MDYLSKFSIPFANLTYGVHRYEYEIGNTFFESFENSIINNAKVHVNLAVDRQEAMIIIGFSIKGIFELICDRCLGKFDYEVEKNNTLVIKLAEESGEDEDEVITISKNEHSINIAQHLYDYMSLMIPYRKIHPEAENGESGCDPDFLRRIEGLSYHQEDHDDPRWEELKKLRKK